MTHFYPRRSNGKIALQCILKALLAAPDQRLIIQIEEGIVDFP